MGYNESGPEAVLTHRPGLTAETGRGPVAESESTEPVRLRECFADVVRDLAQREADASRRVA